ncbi:MAG: PH domain-containing protein [Candidatus Lokiarchaeota archaeon]|nr:PH domain-containing protein [Candidatus Lokiarchaeota archaeon]MBD3342198.1 PH domain-containing protein [Candidatus Lokiarchaeota archaeon]
MRKDKFYEGSIHRDFRKKNLLKINLILIGIFSIITLIAIGAVFNLANASKNAPRPPILSNIVDIGLNQTAEIIFWVLLEVVIIPFIVINIIVHLYLTAYTKNFTYQVSEDNIIIRHGVFTRTKVTIPFIRIQNINVLSGLFDRFFNLYTVKIETAGASGSVSGGTSSTFRPEGLIPGIKEPDIIEDKINQMMSKHSKVPTGLQDKIFKPEELAFDNFISYILSKMREGEKLKTNITTLRERVNLTVGKLAAKVGVPEQTIRYLEEGRYNPSLTLAYKIAQELNCKIEDLFELA